MQRFGVGRASVRLLAGELTPDTVPSRSCEECRLCAETGDDGGAAGAAMCGAGVWEVAPRVMASNKMSW